MYQFLVMFILFFTQHIFSCEQESRPSLKRSDRLLAFQKKLASIDTQAGAREYVNDGYDPKKGYVPFRSAYNESVVPVVEDVPPSASIEMRVVVQPIDEAYFALEKNRACEVVSDLREKRKACLVSRKTFFRVLMLGCVVSTLPMITMVEQQRYNACGAEYGNVKKCSQLLNNGAHAVHSYCAGLMRSYADCVQRNCRSNPALLQFVIKNVTNHSRKITDFNYCKRIQALQNRTNQKKLLASNQKRR